MILFLCAPAVLINLEQVSIKMIHKRLWNVAMNIFRHHQQVLIMLRKQSLGSRWLKDERRRDKRRQVIKNIIKLRQNLKCSAVESSSWYEQHQICWRFGGQCPVFWATRCGMPGLVGKDGTKFSCERPCWCCPGGIGKEVKFWVFLLPTKGWTGQIFFLWGGAGQGKGQNLRVFYGAGWGNHPWYPQ